jgi:hypothetical protein
LSNNSHSEKEFVHEQYEQMLRAHQQDETVLVSHYGELSQSVISHLEGNVEEKITSLEIAKGPIKKIFFISVETLQNMLLHGQKNSQGEQHNFFILVKNGSNLKVISSNLVANSSIPALEKQINTINSFDDEKVLKSYYLEHLENNTMSEKGGAGLGFITIVMKSGNKLKVDFKKINDEVSLFTLTSSVNLS